MARSSTPGEATFSSPGGRGAAATGPRPVDLAHLARQTLGDRELEREVLKLFLQQAASVRDRIADAGVRERLFLAHSLKGSARGVGAFAVAECARAIENSPADRGIIERLADLIDEVRDFAAAINR